MHPYLLHVGHLALPTSGVLTTLGLLLSLLLSGWTARRAGVDPDKLWDAGLFLIVSAYVLSRLLLLASSFRAFMAVPVLLLAVPSLTTAGVMLTIVATLGWLRVQGVPRLRALDAWSPCATLVWTAVSLGHVAAGTDLGFQRTLLHPGQAEAVIRYPVAQLSAALALALTARCLLWLRGRRPPGEIAALTLILAGVGEFVLTFLRPPPALPGFGGLPAFEWKCAAMIACGGLLLAFLPRPNPQISAGPQTSSGPGAAS